MIETTAGPTESCARISELFSNHTYINQTLENVFSSLEKHEYPKFASRSFFLLFFFYFFFILTILLFFLYLCCAPLFASAFRISAQLGKRYSPNWKHVLYCDPVESLQHILSAAHIAMYYPDYPSIWPPLAIFHSLQSMAFRIKIVLCFFLSLARSLSFFAFLFHANIGKDYRADWYKFRCILKLNKREKRKKPKSNTHLRNG